MRVLVALGGNAMTGPDGSAARGAARRDRARHGARRRPRRRGPRGRAHPRQRAPGRQPPRQEESPPCRAAGAAGWCGAQTQGTIGFTMLDSLEAALATARPSPPGRRPRDPHPRRRRDPGSTNPTKPIGRFLPASRPGRSSTTASAGRTAARRAGAASSPPPSRSRYSRPHPDDPARRRLHRRRGRWRRHPVVRDEGGRRGRRGRHRQGPHRRVLARAVGADVLVIATDVAHAIAGWGTPDAHDIGRVTLAEMEAYAAAGHFASGRWAPRSRPRCASSGPAGPARSSRPSTSSPRPSTATSGPSSKTQKEKGDSRARSH